MKKTKHQLYDSSVRGDNNIPNRRKLLKNIVAGSAFVTGSNAIPEIWVKPITDSVVIPGHAATSIGDYVPGDRYAGDYYGDGPFSEDQDIEAFEDYETSGDYSSDGDFGEDNGLDHSDDSDTYHQIY